MATKKRKEQLESLLDWEKEGGRLPEIVEMFNRRVSPTFTLHEIDVRAWEIEAIIKNDGDIVKRVNIPISHTTLIQLGLTILDAIKYTDDRFQKGKGNT